MGGGRGVDNLKVNINVERKQSQFYKSCFEIYFQIIDMKTFYFHVNLLTYKILLYAFTYCNEKCVMVETEICI